MASFGIYSRDQVLAQLTAIITAFRLASVEASAEDFYAAALISFGSGSE